MKKNKRFLNDEKIRIQFQLISSIDFNLVDDIIKNLDDSKLDDYINCKKIKADRKKFTSEYLIINEDLRNLFKRLNSMKIDINKYIKFYIESSFIDDDCIEKLNDIELNDCINCNCKTKNELYCDKCLQVIDLFNDCQLPKKYTYIESNIIRYYNYFTQNINITDDRKEILKSIHNILKIIKELTKKYLKDCPKGEKYLKVFDTYFNVNEIIKIRRYKFNSSKEIKHLFVYLHSILRIQDNHKIIPYYNNMFADEEENEVKIKDDEENEVKIIKDDGENEENIKDDEEENEENIKDDEEENEENEENKKISLTKFNKFRFEVLKLIYEIKQENFLGKILYDEYLKVYPNKDYMFNLNNDLEKQYVNYLKTDLRNKVFNSDEYKKLTIKEKLKVKQKVLCEIDQSIHIKHLVNTVLYIDVKNKIIHPNKDNNTYIGDVNSPDKYCVLPSFCKIARFCSSDIYSSENEKKMKSKKYSPSYEYVNDKDQYISASKFDKLSSKEQSKYMKKFIDNMITTVCFDTETKNKILINFIKSTEKVLTNTINKIIKLISKIPPKTIEKYNKQNFNFNGLISDKLLLISKPVIISCVLRHKERVLEGEYYTYKEHVQNLLFVDNEHKKEYGKDNISFSYNYKKELINEDCEIKYTDNLCSDFISYCFNWFNKIVKNSYSKHQQMTFWAHNSKYDMLNIGIYESYKKYNLDLTQDERAGIKFTNFKYNKPVVNIKGKAIHPNILFLDSMNFFKSNLESVGNSIGISKLKSNVEFTEFNTNLECNNKTLEYAIVDSVILDKWLFNFKKECNMYSQLKYGSAGTAINVFYSSFYDDSNYYKKGEKIISEKEYKELENIDKRGYKRINYRINKHKNLYYDFIEFISYCGGRTECFNKIGYYDNVISYDINSSYPSIMLNKIPLRLLYTKALPDKKELFDIINDDERYCLCKIKILKCNKRIVPIKHDNKTLFPEYKNTVLMVNEPELKLLIENNTVFQIIDMHVYSATTKLFEKFVNLYMFQKTYYKSVVKDKLLQNLAKLYVNSSYGKFGERYRINNIEKVNKFEKELRYLISYKENTPEDKINIYEYSGYINYKDETFWLSNEDDILNDDFKFVGVHNKNSVDLTKLHTYLNNHAFIYGNENIRINLVNGTMVIKKKILFPSERASCIIATAITSYARTSLYNGMKLIGFDNMIYCDTDSIYFKNDIDQSKIMNDVFDKLKKKDIDISTFETLEEYLQNVDLIKSVSKEDKINIGKNYVVNTVLWEVENDGKPIIMNTRGLKDNDKFIKLDKNDIFILENENDINKFKESNFNYAMNKQDIKKYSQYKQDGKYIVKLSERLKGINSNAIEINDNLYWYPKWYSSTEQTNKYHNTVPEYLTSQIIEYQLKSTFNSRNKYEKAYVIDKSKYTHKYINIRNLKDNFGCIIEDKVLLTETIKRDYVEQILQPFLMVNNEIVDYDKLSNQTDRLKLKDII